MFSGQNTESALGTEWCADASSVAIANRRKAAVQALPARAYGPCENKKSGIEGLGEVIITPSGARC